MFLQPGYIRVVWYGGLVGAQFGSSIQPLMVFDVSVGKRDRTTAVVIVGGNIANLGVRAGVDHVYDKKTVIDGISPFIDEDEGCGRAWIIDGGEFVRVGELGQGGAVIFASVQPLVHGNGSDQWIIYTVDVDRVGVSGAN